MTTGVCEPLTLSTGTENNAVLPIEGEQHDNAQQQALNLDAEEQSAEEHGAEQGDHTEQECDHGGALIPTAPTDVDQNIDDQIHVDGTQTAILTELRQLNTNVQELIGVCRAALQNVNGQLHQSVIGIKRPLSPSDLFTADLKAKRARLSVDSIQPSPVAAVDSTLSAMSEPVEGPAARFMGRRKTSPLWQFFVDTGRSVRCMVVNPAGVRCTYERQEKYNTNMEYHLKRAHAEDGSMAWQQFVSMRGYAHQNRTGARMPPVSPGDSQDDGMGVNGAIAAYPLEERSVTSSSSQPSGGSLKNERSPAESSPTNNNDIEQQQQLHSQSAMSLDNNNMNAATSQAVWLLELMQRAQASNQLKALIMHNNQQQQLSQQPVMDNSDEPLTSKRSVAEPSVLYNPNNDEPDTNTSTVESTTTCNAIVEQPTTLDVGDNVGLDNNNVSERASPQFACHFCPRTFDTASQAQRHAMDVHSSMSYVRPNQSVYSNTTTLDSVTGGGDANNSTTTNSNSSNHVSTSRDAVLNALLRTVHARKGMLHSINNTPQNVTDGHQARRNQSSSSTPVRRRAPSQGGWTINSGQTMPTSLVSAANNVSGTRGFSRVWQWFVYKTDTNKSACQLCSTELAGKYTSNLQKHLRTSHPDAFAMMRAQSAAVNDSTIV